MLPLYSFNYKLFSFNFNFVVYEIIFYDYFFNCGYGNQQGNRQWPKDALASSG